MGHFGRSEHKVKGGRQRLKKEEDVDLDTGTRVLDKLETVTTKEMETGIRAELLQLVADHPPLQLQLAFPASSPSTLHPHPLPSIPTLHPPPSTPGPRLNLTLLCTLSPPLPPKVLEEPHSAPRADRQPLLPLNESEDTVATIAWWRQ